MLETARENSLARATAGWIVSGALVACLPNPSKTFPKDRRPDPQCRTGIEAGYDILIGECYHGQYVAIFQRSSALCGAGRPERQIA